MSVKLIFPTDDTAQIEVDTTARALMVYPLIVVVVVMCIVCLTRGDPFLQVLGVVFAAMSVLMLLEAGPLVRAAAYHLEVDKVLTAVRYTADTGATTTMVVGGFREIRRLQTRTLETGTGSMNFYILQLHTDRGHVDLFALFSNDEVMQIGQELAAWLGVPFKDGGRIDYAKWMRQKSSFAR